MIRNILIYAVVALSALSASALPRLSVYPSSLDASTIAAICQTHARSGSSQSIQAIVEFAVSADIAAVAARYPDIRINTVTGSLASVIIPKHSLETFASDTDVIHIIAGSEVRPMTDEARHLSNVDNLHSGNVPSATSYTGKGIIIGIIDSGFDFQHPAFFDADGHCRISNVWDQNRFISNVGTPSDFGYGFVLNAAEEIATAAHDMSGDTHGTHVAAIAASSADAYKGMAPDAEIALVSTNRSETGIIDGLNYLLSYAEKCGKPIAINLSMGTVIGFKDGSDPLARMIDGLLSDRKGQLVAIAAGNEGVRRSTIIRDHTHTESSAITTRLQPPSYNRENIFAGASAGTDFTLHLCLRDNAGNPLFGVDIPSIQKEGGRYDNLTGGNDGSYVVVSTATNTETGAGSISVNLYYPLAEGQYWDAMITGDEGRYILTADYGELTEGSTSSTIACTACGYEPLSVGAYVSRTNYINLDGTTCSNGWTFGDEYPLSGKGPTLDGRHKPDVLAPGASVISAINSYAASYSVNRQDLILSQPDTRISGRTNYWGVMNGTSMATPVAAGIMALWLQADPDLTSSDIHRIVSSSTKIDATSGLIEIIAGAANTATDINNYVYDPTTRSLTISGLPAKRIELYAINGLILWSATECRTATLPAAYGPSILRISFADGSISTIKIF